MESRTRKFLCSSRLRKGIDAMNGKLLAFVGVGLYILQVVASGTDAKGTTLAPDALILFAGTASLVYVIVAAVKLWKTGPKRTALALPITHLASSASIFLTANPSNLNLLINAIRVLATVTYFYAAYVLYTSENKREAPS
jgi:hypothetical protein